MSYKSRLIRTRQARSELPNGARKTEPERMTKQGFHSRVPEFHLRGGRIVHVEEFYAGVSTLGFLAGDQAVIRQEVIKQLPERVRSQFPATDGILIKPLPSDWKLPRYVIMVSLRCDKPVSDPSADSSNLVICWLSNDIETSLPELISREICSLDWDEHALDSNL